MPIQKSNLLQLAIVICGIILGFLSLQYLLASLVGIIYILSDRSGFGEQGIFFPLMSVIIPVLLQTICSWLLISRSKSISGFIQTRSKLPPQFSVSSNTHELLFIILVVIGIYMLIINLSPLLNSIVLMFRQKVSPGIFDLPFEKQKEGWLKLCLDILLPLILLMFARPIANYFTGFTEGEQLSIEENNENEITEPNDN